MSKLCSLLLAAFALLPAACSTVTARADYVPGTDYSGYRTFAWLEPHILASAEDHELVTPMLIDRIEAEVERGLGALGITRVEREAADLLVRKQLSVREQLKVNDPYYSYDSMQVYEVGSLVIDLIDSTDERLVWRGIGEARILDLKTPEERMARIQEVVDAILANFPPPASAN